MLTLISFSHQNKLIKGIQTTLRAREQIERLLHGNVHLTTSVSLHSVQFLEIEIKIADFANGTMLVGHVFHVTYLALQFRLALDALNPHLSTEQIMHTDDQIRLINY